MRERVGRAPARVDEQASMRLHADMTVCMHMHACALVQQGGAGLVMCVHAYGVQPYICIGGGVVWCGTVQHDGDGLLPWAWHYKW